MNGVMQKPSFALLLVPFGIGIILSLFVEFGAPLLMEPPPPLMNWLFLMGLMGWVASLLLFIDDVARWEKSSGSRLTFLTQKIIDQKLQDLAVTFDAVCKAQVSLMREDSFDSSLESMEKEIATIKSKVAIAKEAFWNAHKLAKELGFQVREKYQQYLPQVT